MADGRAADYTLSVGDAQTISGFNSNNGWTGEETRNHSWTVTSGSDVVRITSGKQSANATVEALSAGQATITHSYRYRSSYFGNSSNREESFTIQVNRALTVTIDDASIEAGSDTIAHATGAEGSVTWSSSNASVARVNQSTGHVTGVAKGTADIIATDSTGATGRVSVRVTPMMCTITFDLDGGQWSGNNGLHEGANEREFGTQLWSEGTDLNSPTKRGYHFVGWTPTVSRTVVGDATYTANWVSADEMVPVYVYTKVNGSIDIRIMRTRKA